MKPKIEEHDFQFKLRNALRFLEDGDKAAEMGSQIMQRGYRSMKSDAVIVGNPIRAAEQLRPFKDMGFTDATCRCMSIPHEETLESISLLAQVRAVSYTHLTLPTKA